MKISNEREEKYYVFDVEISKEDFDILVDYGLRRIKGDKEELFNYAINEILKEYIENSIFENDFTSYKFSIKNSLLSRLLRYIKSRDVGQEITRKELFDKLTPDISYRRNTSLDTYRLYMERAGFLKTIKRGKYKRVKDFSIWLTKMELYNMAYPKN